MPDLQLLVHLHKKQNNWIYFSFFACFFLTVTQQCLVLKYMVGPARNKDMQISPPPLRSGPIFMKDVHSAESNEKSCFRFFQFLVFKLWLSLSYLTLTSSYVCNLRWHNSCATDQKKVFQKWSNSQERCALI